MLGGIADHRLVVMKAETARIHIPRQAGYFAHIIGLQGIREPGGISLVLLCRRPHRSCITVYNLNTLAKDTEMNAVAVQYKVMLRIPRSQANIRWR